MEESEFAKFAILDGDRVKLSYRAIADPGKREAIKEDIIRIALDLGGEEYLGPGFVSELRFHEPSNAAQLHRQLRWWLVDCK